MPTWYRVRPSNVAQSMQSLFFASKAKATLWHMWHLCWFLSMYRSTGMDSTSYNGMHAWSALTGLTAGAAFTSYQLLSVASGQVNKGASQVTVEMRYIGRAIHRRLIDCKYSALCACAEELWPVLTAIDFSFECSNTAIPFDTEVRSIDCQAMTWVFACHALLSTVASTSGRLGISVAEPAGSQQDGCESSKQPSQRLFSLH